MKNESGRSMVEMFGVLAIVGLLSLGGFVAYKIGIRKFQTAQAIDLAEKFSFLVVDHCRMVYDAHGTALASVESCTANTPRIPTFEEVKIGKIPSSIHGKGITFTKITKPENDEAYIVHVKLDFKLKDNCLDAKYFKDLTVGCNELNAPFSITVKTLVD